MAKSPRNYVCSECGWDGSKWYGRCPNCGQWGTIEEFHESSLPSSHSRASSSRSLTQAETEAILKPVTDEGLHDVVRLSTGFEEFNRVLGGGIVPGAVILMAGEPGIGKSTLLLETAGNISRALQAEGKKILYISGEESLAQIPMRARRIGAVVANLLLASTTDLATVVSLIRRESPALAIVDSVQTIYDQETDGIPGGSTQVRQVAVSLIDCAKSLGIPILLVGHVTKDGSIAGPRTLEHLVDVVCQFEGDNQTALRLLRSLKNRFGPTDEVGCFDMSGEGIEEVADPSGLFVSDSQEQSAGTCVTFIVDGHRSLPLEIQALVTSSVLPSPRRTTNGVDYNRLAMIVAVLHRHGRISLLNNDIYVSTIAGGSAREPACDLAIAAALASAAREIPIDRQTLCLGEISLTGQIRPVPRITNRLREAARIGFTRALVPRHRKGSPWYKEADSRQIGNLDLVEVSSLKEALEQLL